MGSNVKEKSARNARNKHRNNPKPPPPPSSDPVTAAVNLNPNTHSDHHAIALAPNLNLPAPNPSSIEESGWAYCTEDQLKDILLKNLDFIYSEALSRLVSLGYDEPLALRALLFNGFCYGSMDALSNILHNAITYLNSPSATSCADCAASFSDLRLLQDYSLSGLVCLLRQLRPHLTRGDAMYCLLISGLHFERATTVEIPTSNIAMTTPSEKATPLTPPLEKARPLPSDSNVVASVMESLERMSINEEEKPEEEEKEKVLSLIRHIENLEAQVKERKEWAQEKALQAAKKLSKDLTELKVLRMEREENQRVKNIGKQQAVEDTTNTKRLSEMESALKKASVQVDIANSAVSRLQADNAIIRAEMEASKLSASESVSTCLEVAKREKRSLKRLSAWEKQREKLQEDVVEEKKRVAEMQRQIDEVIEAKKETELKWREEIKAKEQAITQVEDERRAKEAVEGSIKRKHEALQSKIEIDFQRHKDDIHRLEEELSRLIGSTGSAQANVTSSGDAYKPKLAKSSNLKNAQGPKESKDSRPKVNHGRECVICRNDEVNVVFLPCAHQVLCVGCSEEQERKAQDVCPCCDARIDQRIRVFGAAC